jgi:hypothetical protein
MDYGTVMIDLLEIMSPKTSTCSSFSLSHAGIHPLWTAIGVVPLLPNSTSIPTPRSPASSQYSTTTATHLSSDTTSSDATFHSTALKEPIRQGSAAWHALKINQQQGQGQVGRNQSSPSYGQIHAPGAGLVGTPASRGDGSESKDADHPGITDREYLRIIDDLLSTKRLNKLGKGIKLPSTEREGLRKLILAICGEGVERYVGFPGLQIRILTRTDLVKVARANQREMLVGLTSVAKRMRLLRS